MRRTAMGLLALCIPVAGVFAAPPVEVFTNFPKFESLKISPTGEFLALTRRTTEHEVMTILNMPALTLSSQAHFGSLTDVASFQWVSRTRLLIEPERRFPGFTAYKAPTGEIIGMDADGKNTDLLFGYAAGKMQTGTKIAQRQSVIAAARIMGKLPAFPDDVLIQTYGYGMKGEFNAAYRMNVKTGALVKLADSPIRNGSFVADGERKIRLVSGADAAGNHQIFLRAPNSEDWKIVSTTEQLKGALWPLAPYGEGGEFLAIENLEVPTDGVVAWNPVTGKERQLYRHPGIDVSEIERDADGKPWMFSFTDHYPGYWYPDPGHPLAVVHQGLRKMYPEQEIRITSATDDLSLAVARVSSARMPPVFFVIDTKSRKVLQQLQAYPDLKAEDLSPVEPIEFKARDGLTIRGYITTPRVSGGKRLPLVVMVHGGPHGVFDDYDFDFERQLLASRGYAVLQVNYRGSGGRGSAFEGAGYGRWGREMEDDITDGVRWVIGDGVADAKRICIYGASYGAYAALTGAFREPDLYRCAIGMAGVYDLPLMFEKGDIQTVERGVNYLKQAVGTDKEELKRRSPVYNADKIHAAVLLLHGNDDERAPFEHARRMRAALQKAGNAPEWLTESGEGHGFFNEAHRVEAYTKILAFLEKHLGATSPGP